MTIKQLYELYLKHSKVTTDSRKVGQGELFFALKGERFDGNQFAKQALEKGAAYAIVDDESLADEERCLFVDNTLVMLQRLARFHRKRFDIPIIGITGSNGKTTTKELISSVLCSHYNCHYTRGNFNNHIGVPLTLLAMPLNTEVAIIEMGANHQGEIGFLCQIAEPTHGLITNIGQAHLEGFGGIEGVKKGKSELYAFLAKTDGVAFINRNAEFLADLARARNVEKTVFYCRTDQPSVNRPEYEFVLLATQPMVQIAFLDEKGQKVQVDTHLVGEYNFDNVMSAVALGKYFKVPLPKIKEAIAAYIPANNRSQLIKADGGITFILDAYNANPSSMEVAIANFGEMSSKHKTVILGEMLELGEYSDEAHNRIVELVLEKPVDRIILVGRAFAKSAEQHGLPHFDSVEELIPWWVEQEKKPGHVLIKGSRAIRLERLLEQSSSKTA